MWEPGLEINREAVWDMIGYKPHPKQLLVHDSDARFKIPVCGRRFGKSKLAAAEALTNKKFNLFMPDVRGWIVAPKYITGEKEFRYIWDFFVLKMGLGPKIKRKAYNVRTGDMFIELPWGARIDVLSAQHKDTLVGEGLHFVIMSEAAKQPSETWHKYLRATLADYAPDSWACFPTTPEGFNWFFELAELGNSKSMTFNDTYETWNFPSWDNPYVYPGGETDTEILTMKDSMAADVFGQEIAAQFTSTVGLIYPEWDNTEHIIEEYEYNPEWPNYLFVDFGYTNPFVALDVQVSPSDEVYVWRERYVSKEAIHKHLYEMKSRPQPSGYSLKLAFGDAADPEAIAVFNEIFGPMVAEQSAKDWARGVAEVKRFLRSEDGKARLHVHKSCVNTIAEFQSYRMHQPRQEEENKQERARKFADHAMDALRYGIMHLFVLSAGRYSLADVYEITDVASPEDGGIFTGGESSVFTAGGAMRW